MLDTYKTKSMLLRAMQAKYILAHAEKGLDTLPAWILKGIDNDSLTISRTGSVMVTNQINQSHAAMGDDWVVFGELGVPDFSVRKDSIFKMLYEESPGGAGALPDFDASKPDDEPSLMNKLWISRTDGADVPGEEHEHCQYFALDTSCDELAVDIMRQYAQLQEERGFVKLAAEVIAMADKIQNERG